MKNAKSILVLLLALVMVVGMMAGCSSGQSSTPTATESNKEATDAQDAAAAPQETVTIKWYRRAYNTNTDTDKVAAAINEYIEPLIGVNVEIVDENNYQIDLELASGGDVDLFWTASWFDWMGYINNGAVMDLAGMLDNYPTLKSSIPSNVWEAATWNGHNWYIPVYKESAVGAQIAVPKDIYDKYCPDLKSVSSFSDLEPYLKAMKADGMTCALDMTSSGYLYELRNSYYDLEDTIWVDDDMKVFPLYECDMYKEYLDTIYRYNQAGYIPADQYEKPADSTEYRKSLLADGNWGFSLWVKTPDGEANAKARFGIDMVLIDFTPTYLTTKSPMGSMYMINSQSEKADACLKFLGLLYTDPVVADLACFGIEGEHYDMVDGRVQVRAESGYKYGGVWCVTNVMAPDLQVGESEDKKQQYAEFNANAEISPICGFVFDGTAVEAEKAAVKAAIDEYDDLLERGFYDPEEYLPKYIAALQAAGIDKVVAEYQTQLDAFLAGK